MMHFYICSYNNYTELPVKLFHEHIPPGKERQSIDGTKFIARCEIDAPTTGCLSWMNGTEQSFTHDEIRTELKSIEWQEED
jgi:hypothetical protein